MGYRTERKHKQSQRAAYADWQCEQDRKQEQHFEPVEEGDFEIEYSEWSEDRKAREVEMMRGW